MEYTSLLSGFEESNRDPNLAVVYEDNVRTVREIVSVIVQFIAVYSGVILVFSIARIALVPAVSTLLFIEDFVELAIGALGLVTAYLGLAAVKEPTRYSTYRFAVCMHCFCPLYVVSLTFYCYCRSTVNELTAVSEVSILGTLAIVAFICGFFVLQSKKFYSSLQDYLRAKPITGSYKSPASILYK